jgi:flagellar M-ring protein FliF
MMWFEELKSNLLALWQRMEPKQRIGSIAAMSAAVLLVAGIAYWAIHTNYEVLFSDLDERDAANIVADLKQSKTPYRLSDDGHRILVPESQVYETRLRLMGKGVLLNGGVGFEIFDNKDLGMTEYTQKINYQRALQGELARTIMSMAPVKLARVQLVLAEASIFKHDKVKPKASVSLVLHAGAQLTNDQILGIQRLVSASVPGLEAPAVTISDQRGMTLSALVDGEGNGAAVGSKLRMKREVEEYLTRKIIEVMDRTYGPGQAIVSVDVALNFDEIHRTDQDVIPFATSSGEATGVVVRKRQSIYRQGKDGISKTTDGIEASSPSSNLNSTNEVEYEVSRRVEQVVTAPGGIRRVSVGVVLPGNVNAEQLANVKQVVTMVAGLSEDRGDAIVVQGIDQLILPNAHPGAGMSTTDKPQEPAASNLLAHMDVRTLGVAVAVIGLLMAAWATILIVRRRRRARTGEEIDARTLLLAEVRHWLDSEKAASAGVTKP